MSTYNKFTSSVPNFVEVFAELKEYGKKDFIIRSALDEIELGEPRISSVDWEQAVKEEQERAILEATRLLIRVDDGTYEHEQTYGYCMMMVRLAALQLTFLLLSGEAASDEVDFESEVCTFRENKKQAAAAMIRVRSQDQGDNSDPTDWCKDLSDDEVIYALWANL